MPSHQPSFQPSAPLPPIELVRTLDKSVDVLVVGYRDGQAVGVPESLATSFRRQYGRDVGELVALLGLSSAKPLSTRTLPPPGGSGSRGPVLVVVSLGTTAGSTSGGSASGGDEISAETLRQAAGSGVRAALAGEHERPVSVAVALGAETAETVAAVTEGALLGHYRFTPVSGTEPKSAPVRLSILSTTTGRPAKALGEALASAQLVAAAVIQARDWINLPPNLLYPESFAESVRGYVRDTRISLDVLDEGALASGGYGGIMAVGGGSSRPPRLVRLSYAPRGAKAHLVLVGKGITFDSGGLDLKTADGMYTMKCDMSGAAAVLAATRAIADLGLKVKVTCYAAMAENLPSATAFRPSDVLTMYGGTTVENGNSDAEGRLVMADALARSAEDQPDLVIDVATLTGACVTALGSRTSGVMSNDDSAADRVLAAARRTGEAFWRLPIPDETRGRLDSTVADLRSTAADRPAGASVAAAFLREFVPAGISWAHLDIAGTAFHTGSPYGCVPVGGTGVAVRTLVALAAELA